MTNELHNETTRQAVAAGLAPLLDALDHDSRIDSVAVENTGGNCLAVTVPDQSGDRLMAITLDGSTYYVATYSGDAWDEGGDPDETFESTDVAEVVEWVAEGVWAVIGPCAVCGAPATDEVCDINRMPAGVMVWVPVCDAHQDEAFK
jgi:hypothetical protein